MVNSRFTQIKPIIAYSLVGLANAILIGFATNANNSNKDKSIATVITFLFSANTIFTFFW